jgi:hypothetical protein
MKTGERSIALSGWRRTVVIAAIALATGSCTQGLPGHEKETRGDLALILVGLTPNLSGLVARYTFTGNANDSVSGRNLSVGAGAPTLTADRFGTPASAYSFNGASYFTASDSIPTALPSGSNPRTVCIWYNLTTLSGVTLTNYGTGVAGQAFGLGTNSLFSSVFTYTYDLNIFLSPRTNVWTHYCGVYSGSDIKAYINGALVAETTATSSGINTVLSSLAVGKSNFQADFLTGSLDDLRIYNRALSAIDVAAIYSGW